MVNDQHAVKKCPSCGKYSAWRNAVDDSCEFCGAILDPRKLREVQAAELKAEKARLNFEHPVFWVSIKPTDKPIVVFWKEILRAGQLVYMAIVSFLLWITAIVAG